MGSSHDEALVVKPETILGGLDGIEWCVQTSKVVEKKQNAIHLFGYLNPLRSTRIAIISPPEMEWIYAQTENDLSQSPAFCGEFVVAIILCGGCKENPALNWVCEQHNIALVSTVLPHDMVLEYLLSRLPRLVALRDTKHGVFLAVLNAGVLVTGTSGVGKSEVAMDLIQRGHQLIADDAVDVHRNEQNELIGECPEALRGYIEIRGLGIISILKMFGPSAVLDTYRLQLIIDLQDSTDSEVRKIDRLSPSLEMRDILGVSVPCLTMLVAPGRNLSVLIEAAVRDHLLRISGTDSGRDFQDQHEDIMKKER